MFKPGDLVKISVRDTDEFTVWSTVVVQRMQDVPGVKNDYVMMQDGESYITAFGPRRIAMVVAVHPVPSFRQDVRAVYVVGDGFCGWTWSWAWEMVRS